MSISDTLAERGSRYGSFTSHSLICQSLKTVMTGSGKWEKLAPDQKQALEVIADKIARILNGDPDYADNWHDIQGYAKLVEDRLLGANQAQSKQTELINEAKDQVLGQSKYDVTGLGEKIKLTESAYRIMSDNANEDKIPLTPSEVIDLLSFIGYKIKI